MKVVLDGFEVAVSPTGARVLAELAAHDRGDRDAPRPDEFHPAALASLVGRHMAAQHESRRLGRSYVHLTPYGRQVHQAIEAAT